MNSHNITNFTVLGERTSGTKYLVDVIKSSFNLPITWNYGWKHFFEPKKYQNTDETLFIGIVRDPMQWLGSFFAKPYHVPPVNKGNWTNFLTNEWWSIYDERNHGPARGSEIMLDRNIHTGERYKNIFEMRATKNKFLLDDMPKLVKYYILIRYEDLLENPNEILEKISKLINKPVNVKNITTSNNFRPNKRIIPEAALAIVNTYLNKEIESRLQYIVP